MINKITIINAYGDNNIGDAAILNVAISFIKSAYGNTTNISVLCESQKGLSKFIHYSKNIVQYQSPYGYAIKGNKTKISYFLKLFRFIKIYMCSYYFIYMNKLLDIPLPKDGFYSYINRISSTDITLGMGGGYLTTNNKFKDYFGLFLSLLPIYIAKIYNKKIIMLPMSFGPFASSLQKKIAYNALKDTTFMARDNITLNKLKKIDAKNRVKKFYIPDLALFTERINGNISNKKKNDYIVLTAREWFSNNRKQKKYESSITNFVNIIWQTYGLKTIFIPMAKNKIEDDDNRIAKRILKSLSDKKSFAIFNPKSIKDLQYKIANAKVAVCTRMHSAIIASVTFTPFIAIGYGHKTLGFMQKNKLEKWHIDIKDLTTKKLLLKFNLLINDREYKLYHENLINLNKKISTYKEFIITKIKINAEEISGSKIKILGLTTDPYENIYGYSLVFFRLIDFMQKTNKKLDVHLISNDGQSSKIVKNDNFISIKLDKNKSTLSKTIILTIRFIKIAYSFDKNTIIIANCEIPELMAALILKMKFKNVYGVIQDDRIRKDSIYTKFVCKARILLLYAIKNIIFTNHYTMNKFSNSVNKYYIGNPIFY